MVCLNYNQHMSKSDFVKNFQVLIFLNNIKILLLLSFNT